MDGFEFLNWDGDIESDQEEVEIVVGLANSVAANFKDVKAPTVTVASPSSAGTDEEIFTLSGGVTDNGKIKSLVWQLRGQEQGELELVEGKFELKNQRLAGGSNAITVIAIDRSGNEGKATATPTWVPNRSIRIAA